MIGVLTTSYPRHPTDHAGGFVRDRVEVLVRGGAAVEVIAAAASGGDALVDGDVRIFRVPSLVAGAPSLFSGDGAPEALERGGLPAWVAALQFATALTALAHDRARRWQALESHWLVPCGIVAALVARGRTHRAFSHGADVALLERLPGGSSVARILAGSGAELVFASGDLRRRFARLAARPDSMAFARVEAAPVDPIAFAPRSGADRQRLRARFGIHHSLVLAVGRLVPIKGFDLLVRAVGRLPRDRRPQVVIVGEGRERAALMGLAHARRVDLRLVGALARPDVADWMAAADLFVHPSRILDSGRCEGMPLSMREARAMGIPVVASATGGVPEIEDRTELTLVPPEDPGALARAILELLRGVASAQANSHGAAQYRESPRAP